MKANRRIDTRNPVNWQHPLNVGTLGWWLMFGSWSAGGTLFDLCRRYDGTLSPTAPTNAPSRPASQPSPDGFPSLLFDGSDDYVSLSSGSILAGRDEWTAAGWFTTTGTTESPMYCERGASGDTIFKVERTNPAFGTGKVEITYRSATGILDRCRSTNTYNDGKWHYIVATCRGGNFALYVDGVQDGSLGRTAGTIMSSVPTSLGLDLQDSGNLWGGGLAGWRTMNVGLDGPAAAALTDQAERGYPDLLQWVSGRTYLFTADLVTTSGLPASVAGGSFGW